MNAADTMAASSGPSAPAPARPSTFARWLKFNLVGIIGATLQLTLLALLHRVTGAHYLIASTIAIELTLLHNFAWHLDYTWRDRRREGSMLAQLLRFHLSNGLVSMAGNLALMPLLVRQAHLPIVAANGIVILCCSLMNFGLGDRLVFAGHATHAQS